MCRQFGGAAQREQEGTPQMIRLASRRFPAAIIAAMALTLGLAMMAGTASAATVAHHATTHSRPTLKGDEAARLQRKAHAYLAAHPGARQATIEIPGGQVTVPAPGHKTASPLLSCSYGHLCIVDGLGYRYDYYRCGRYSFDGVEDGTFNNNQTPGTVAKFYNLDGSLRWTSTAPHQGTASWTPVYKVSPC